MRSIQVFPCTIISCWVIFFSFEPNQYHVLVSSSPTSPELSHLSPSSSLSTSLISPHRMGLTSISSDNIWGKIDVQSGKLKETTTYATIGFVNLSKRSSATTKVSISSCTSDFTGDRNRVQEKIPRVLEVTDQDLGMIYSNFDLFGSPDLAPPRMIQF